MSSNEGLLKAINMGVNTHHELVAFMRTDCPVCRSEGFEALASICISVGQNAIIAKLYIVDKNKLPENSIGFSQSAYKKLGLRGDERVKVSHAPIVTSLSSVRAKIYNRPFSENDLEDIVKDIAKGHYNDIEISSFLTACAGDRLSIDEIAWLTKAMVGAGKRLSWDVPMVMDKHCVGGLPGNRTTPIIVSIVAANGLTIPKTSSRAITSPAGTSDTMEVLTKVDLDMTLLKSVVKQTGGALAWGGNVGISPVDDMLIRVEKVLDLDSEGQLIASVLSKKIAAGSTHVLIDIPIGETAKIRSVDAAELLSRQMQEVGNRLGLHIETIITDGRQPVGRGIGPGLEARDVLAVLRAEETAPDNLRERALDIAGRILEMGSRSAVGEGRALAKQTLESGKAWDKFIEICQAQGGLYEPSDSAKRFDYQSPEDGMVYSVDNRRLARLAKLAGAPGSKIAGVNWNVRLGHHVRKGDSIIEIFAETTGELEYARDYLLANQDMVRIGALT